MIESKQGMSLETAPLIFVDPIGHLLGSHDREICSRLSGRGYSVVLATNEDPSIEEDPSHFLVHTIFRGCVGDGSPLSKGVNYSRSLLRFINLVRRLKPFGVVFYYNLQPAVGTKLVQWLEGRGIRTIVSAHDVLPLGTDKDRSNTYRRLYNSAWRVLAFSEYAKDQLVETLGVPTTKIQTLYFGLQWAGNSLPEDCRELEAAARRNLGLQSNEKVILCFGQIKRNKDLAGLFSSFAKLLSKEQEARLMVIGRPWKVDFESFEKMAVDLKIASKTIFRPEHVPDSEVDQYFHASDIVVIPYSHLYQSATLPMACRYRKPIVATRVGNITEVLQDGESGYLVDPGDWEAMYDAILSALDDPEEARRRGNRAQQTVLEKYSWENFCLGLGKMLENARTPSARC